MEIHLKLGKNMGIDITLSGEELSTAKREVSERPYLRQLLEKFRRADISEDVFYYIHMRVGLSPEERAYVTTELDGEFQRFEKGLVGLDLIHKLSEKTPPWYQRGDLPDEFRSIDPTKRMLMYNENQLHWLNTSFRNEVHNARVRKGSELTQEEIEELKDRCRYSPNGQAQTVRDKWRVFSDWCVDIGRTFPQYNLAGSV